MRAFADRGAETLGVVAWIPWGRPDRLLAAGAAVLGAAHEAPSVPSDGGLHRPASGLGLAECGFDLWLGVPRTRHVDNVQHFRPYSKPIPKAHRREPRRQVVGGGRGILRHRRPCLAPCTTTIQVSSLISLRERFPRTEEVGGSNPRHLHRAVVRGAWLGLRPGEGCSRSGKSPPLPRKPWSERQEPFRFRRSACLSDGRGHLGTVSAVAGCGSWLRRAR